MCGSGGAGKHWPTIDRTSLTTAFFSIWDVFSLCDFDHGVNRVSRVSHRRSLTWRWLLCSTGHVFRCLIQRCRELIIYASAASHARRARLRPRCSPRAGPTPACSPHARRGSRSTRRTAAVSCYGSRVMACSGRRHSCSLARPLHAPATVLRRSTTTSCGGQLLRVVPLE